MNKIIAAVALLLLMGMTWTAEERLRVDGAATLQFTAHAGVTYRVTATSRSSYYAPQPRIVVPTLAIVDGNGTRIAASGVVKQTDDPKFAVQTELKFTAPADGTYTLVVAANRAGEIVGSFREQRVTTGSGGSKSSVVTSSVSMHHVGVRGTSAGIVTVRIVEAAD